jgi:HD-GYP domain-containing protein (c-di-GMP phosphodiesterase class II)
MLQISIENVLPGMVLGKSIYNASGDLLLAAGFRLQEKYVHRLKILGYATLWIQEEGTENVIPETLINEQLALQTNKALRESAQIVQGAARIRGETREEIEKSVKDKDRFKNIIMVEKVKSMVNDIVDSLLTQQDVLININSIRGKDDYLYQHNLDVTITSILLANRLKLNKFEIAEMAMGAIMHDLGMVVVPDTIQKKGSRLTFQ